MAHLVQLICSEELRGKGTPESPLRKVKHYYTPGGELLAIGDDPCRSDMPHVFFEAVRTLTDATRDLLKNTTPTNGEAAGIINKTFQAMKRVDETLDPYLEAPLLGPLTSYQTEQVEANERIQA